MTRSASAAVWQLRPESGFQAHGMFGPAEVQALISGWSGLGLIYAAAQTSMMLGLKHGRAYFRQYVASPIVSVATTVAGGIGVAMTKSSLIGIGIATGTWSYAVSGAAIIAGVSYAGGRLYAASAERSGNTHERGSIVVDSEPQTRTPFPHERDLGVGLSRDLSPKTNISLAGIPIAMEHETKHFKFIGTTGTGKSTAICEILDVALARGDRAIIADPDGGYLKRFYDPGRGDVILNPFDRDSVKWNPFAELKTSKDLDLLASALIPDTDFASGREWRGYARTFLASAMQQLWAAGRENSQRASVDELFRLINRADIDELRRVMEGTAAESLLQPNNERMFGSVRAVAGASIDALKHIIDQDGAAFSVREWVRQGNPSAAHGKRGGVLFIPYQADEIPALRSTISAWMRLSIVEAMKQGEGDQRLWFVADELDALGAIDGLKDALPRLRKFGGRCILGFQSIAQVSSTYGKGDAQTIVENCGNTLILRCSASESGGTSRFASQLIGQRQITRITASRSRRPTDFLSSTTRSEHVNIEAAVMDSEIEQLLDLHGFLKLASAPEWRRVALAPAPRRETAASSERAWRTANEPQRSPPPRPEPRAAKPPPLREPAVPPAKTSAEFSARRSAGPAPKRAPKTATRGLDSPGTLEL